MTPSVPLISLFLPLSLLTPRLCNFPCVLQIWDSYNVKAQTFKTAMEAACMLLRIDDIVSGIKKKQAPGAGPTPSKPKVEEEGDADNEQILPE